jgi:hypothetical protein
LHIAVRFAESQFITWSLLHYDAMQFRRWVTTFRRNMLLPSSEYEWTKLGMWLVMQWEFRELVPICQTTYPKKPNITLHLILETSDLMSPLKYCAIRIFQNVAETTKDTRTQSRVVSRVEGSDTKSTLPRSKTNRGRWTSWATVSSCLHFCIRLACYVVHSPRRVPLSRTQPLNCSLMSRDFSLSFTRSRRFMV